MTINAQPNMFSFVTLSKLQLVKSMQKKRQLSPSMHQSLPSLLFPEYRRRVLGLLLLRPEEALHGREIARQTALPAGTITRELGKLAQAGLLRREKRGNQQVYSADTTSPIFAELASILRKTSGLADVLAQALTPVATHLRVAFVFGSVAQGRESSGSDIDVMLIGDLSFRQAVELLHPTQAVLGREVNPKVFDPAEFTAKAQTEPFLADVLAKPKLFLIGTAHDLAELAGHQP
jgi:predicted nucleotidyltransferase